MEREVVLPASLGIIRAPGSVGTGGIMTRPAPVPLAAIAQENIYSQRLLDSKGNPMSKGRLARLHL